MKHKFSINSAVRLGIVAIAFSGLSGTAFAQYSRPYPTPDLSGSSSPAQGAGKAKANTAGRNLSSADKAFIKDAAQGGMMEVAMGRVAEQDATDSEVKNLGERMVKDHENDLAAFEKQAKEVSNPDVKSFASKTSEVVRKHLEMAKKIDSKLK